MTQDQVVKKIGIGALCFLAVILLIVIKVFFSSMKEYNKAEAAFSERDYRTAITHYERAILWYLPFGGHVDRSAAQLWAIAEILEVQDKPLALEAYRSLRSVFYATRSFYTPGKDWIDRANPKIARLMAEQTIYSEADRKKSIAKKTEEALAILQRPMKPDAFWSIVLEIGFLGWVGGVLLFIWRAFREGGTQIIAKRGLFWGSIVIFFYALWIVGMMKA
ncbi:MAG: hypothetical protein ACE5GK_10445 [Nitrospiria bacterium]